MGDNKCRCKKEFRLEQTVHENYRYCCKEGQCLNPCEVLEDVANHMDPCNLQPCLMIEWGDGPDDHLETDDVEVLCLKFKNCFKMISFENVKINNISITLTPDDILPDHTPSVMIKPDCEICFGNIAPCKEESREVVLITRGAQDYHHTIYTIHVHFTYKVCGNECYEKRADFKLPLVKS